MTFFETARSLLNDGIAAIPCRTDKVSAIKWKDYETRAPTAAELVDWFELETPAAVALVAGKVQCLDFDEKYSAGIFYRFKARAEETGLGGVMQELLRQKTPSGGYHLVWRCEGPTIGNTKLARKANNECMIETRGQGGYFLISPSPGYTLEAGSFADIPKISTEDRDALLDLARTFDERETPKEAGPSAAPASPLDGVSPADDYDTRADVPALLKAHGWRPAGRSDKYWTRPGKARGVSATWGVVPNRFYVFSSSTNLEQGHVYRPAWLYAALECGGDFAKAAGELRRQGFGGARAKLPQATRMVDGFEPSSMELGDSDEPSEIEGIDPTGSAPTTETADERLWRLICACEFDESVRPPPTVPVFELGGVVISTPGNLTAITAQAKVGKSSLVTAMIAATMAVDEDRDTLTARGYNVKGKAVLYVDTEQAKDDFWWSVERAKIRAGLEKRPDWLKAYTLTTFNALDQRKGLIITMAHLAARFDGIYAVIIDGVADLAVDVNDAAECNALVADLQQLAIRYECPIVCVIHKNPGSDKTRGHLGSQIERKAETNLTLEKDGDITVVWSAKQRRAPIAKETGPRFRWSDEAKMHVTVLPDGTGMSQKQQKAVIDYVELAVAVFADRPSMTWSELFAALQEARRKPNSVPGDKTVERWIKVMRQQNVIRLFQGNYTLGLPSTLTEGQSEGN